MHGDASRILSQSVRRAEALLPRFGDVGRRNVAGRVDNVKLVLATLGANVLVDMPACMHARDHPFIHSCAHGQLNGEGGGAVQQRGVT